MRWHPIIGQFGGICGSSSVFEQIRHKLSLGVEDMGPQRVKNIAEPIAAYRLMPGLVASTPTPTPVPEIARRRATAPSVPRAHE